MVRNRFLTGPEGWCSYDYHASMVAGGTNVFILATWAPRGGVGDSGYVWTDHRRWSADTPEKPLAIADGSWAAAPSRVSLRNDESLWHRSWTIDPQAPVSLDRVLGDAESYGFSFVGFSSEVSGRLSMDEFEVHLGE